jgi:hypothetical protein
MFHWVKSLFVHTPESRAAQRAFLRIESGAILLGAVVMYLHFSAPAPNWGLFVLFAALPEAAWLAYLYRKGPSRWPSLAYDAAHSYVTPIFLLIALWTYRPLYLLGWIANIALLRVFGLGFHAPRKG